MSHQLALFHSLWKRDFKGSSTSLGITRKSCCDNCDNDSYILKAANSLFSRDDITALAYHIRGLACIIQRATKTVNNMGNPVKRRACETAPASSPRSKGGRGSKRRQGSWHKHNLGTCARHMVESRAGMLPADADRGSGIQSRLQEISSSLSLFKKFLGIFVVKCS